MGDAVIMDGWDRDWMDEWIPQVYFFSSSVQNRAVRFVTGNYVTSVYDWHSRTTKVGISEKRRRDLVEL